MKQPILECFAFSDIGPVRPNNEDVWASFPQKRFFTIADGMGGHKAGEIAAKEATNFLCKSALDLLKSPSSKYMKKKQIISHLSSSIEKTNHHVYSLGINNENYRGMGTTICCLYLNGKQAIYAHVGDSRIYHISKNDFTLLTKDHSLINKQNPTSCYTMPSSILHKHIITRAIGTTSCVQPDIATITYKKGDVFILCTDGLSDYISHEEIKIILETNNSLKKGTMELINTAKINGSNDNITILMLKITSFYEKPDLLG